MKIVECVYNTDDTRLQRLADVKIKTALNKSNKLTLAIDIVERYLVFGNMDDDVIIILKELYNEEEKESFDILMSLL